MSSPSQVVVNQILSECVHTLIDIETGMRSTFVIFCLKNRVLKMFGGTFSPILDRRPEIAEVEETVSRMFDTLAQDRKFLDTCADKMHNITFVFDEKLDVDLLGSAIDDETAKRRILASVNKITILQ